MLYNRRLHNLTLHIYHRNYGPRANEEKFYNTRITSRGYRPFIA